MKTIHFPAALKIFMCLFFAVMLFLTASCSNSTDPTPPLKTDEDAWKEDLDYFSSELKSRHKNFSSLISEINFDSEINIIKSSLRQLGRDDIYFRLQRLLASLHIAHTYVMPNAADKFHFLPIKTYEFPEGLYITSADPDNASLLGKKILKIGGMDISVVQDSLKKIASYENIYWFKYMYPNYISFVECLKYFGFTDSLSQVEIEIEGGGTVLLKSLERDINSSFSRFINLIDGQQLPLYMQNPAVNYWYSYVEAGKVLYVKYNKCRDMTSQSLAGFTEGMKAFFNSNEVDKFVLDLRDNSGGSSDVLNPLINYILLSEINTKGQLFVITGRNTFSAAVLNAITFKQITNALFIGEPTGGKPNTYGEVETFQLPNSGLVVEYCKKYFETMPDDPESLFPDYPVNITIQDYLNCHDPVMDFILNY